MPSVVDWLHAWCATCRQAVDVFLLALHGKAQHICTTTYIRRPTSNPSLEYSYNSGSSVGTGCRNAGRRRRRFHSWEAGWRSANLRRLLHMSYAIAALNSYITQPFPRLREPSQTNVACDKAKYRENGWHGIIGVTHTTSALWKEFSILRCISERHPRICCEQR